jgi:hypothetical protein
MATKANLYEIDPPLEARFSRLEQKIADVQIRLIKWFIRMAIVQAAVIVALVKLLPGPS